MLKKNKTLKRKCDKLYSKVIRTRDKYTCQKCGKKSDYVHAHHIFGRYNSVRWELETGITLCFNCHKNFFHGHPAHSTEWLIKFKGEQWYLRWLKASKKPRKLDFEEELKRLQLEYNMLDIGENIPF